MLHLAKTVFYYYSNYSQGMNSSLSITAVIATSTISIRYNRLSG
jgi:hypothetical protein